MATEDHRPTEQEVCRHCGGTGHVPKKMAQAFPIGARVHWVMSWWRYPDGADGIVISHSKSGQRVYIEYEENGHDGKPNGHKTRTFVSPHSLELRS